MKPSKNTPPYSLAQEHYLLYSYEHHQNKLQTIYSSRNIPRNKNPFFEKQLQSQIGKPFINKPLRNWNYHVRVENDSLLKRMTEIKNKKQNKNLLPDIGTPQMSKTGSLSKKTLNIDLRIRNIKQIMKENEFLEKRLQTVSSTIDIKKIENGFENSMKNADNISKFSRRTKNCFINKKIPKIPKTPPKNKKRKPIKSQTSNSSPKIQQLNPHNQIQEINISEIDNTNKKDEKMEENGKSNNINQEKEERKEVKINETGSIAESKTLEELLKKQEVSTMDVKQSGLMISEALDNGQNIQNNANQGAPNGLQINIEKSLNLEERKNI